MGDRERSGTEGQCQRDRHAIHANNELDKTLMSEGNSACCRKLLLEILKIQIGLLVQSLIFLKKRSKALETMNKLTSKIKQHNLPTFRQLHDAIIKGTNENKINKCKFKSYN